MAPQHITLQEHCDTIDGNEKVPTRFESATNGLVDQSTFDLDREVRQAGQAESVTRLSKRPGGALTRLNQWRFYSLCNIEE